MVNKIVIITCLRHGMASLCLPALLRNKGVNVIAVVLAQGAGTSRWRLFKRKVSKIVKIGLLGALNGKRVRKWFSGLETKDIQTLCKENDTPFYCVNGLNSPEMESLLRDLNSDLGVSLGNGYIAPRIFQVPKLGMINVHSEILPNYQNAQSILWPIYCNDPYTGFTIHEIERKIDAGRILFQKKYPLRFFKSLENTVRWNVCEVQKDIPAHVAMVCESICEFKERAITQGNGKSYTTASIWQFLRMILNNRRFYKKQEV